MPIGAQKAFALSLVDQVFPNDSDRYDDILHKSCERIAHLIEFETRLKALNRKRTEDEAKKPIASLTERKSWRLCMIIFIMIVGDIKKRARTSCIKSARKQRLHIWLVIVKDNHSSIYWQ